MRRAAGRGVQHDTHAPQGLRVAPSDRWHRSFAASEVIGSYLGAEIRATVTFKGMRYEFAGVVSPAHQAEINANELYLDPGLLYVTRGRR